MRARTTQAGFTLVELIVALVLTVIVSSMAAFFITTPVQGYVDQSRRAGLVDSAESSLRRIARDVRAALPNSVRVTNNGGIVALEILAAVDGSRYRGGPPPGNADAILDFSAADDRFQTTGPFMMVARPFDSTSHYLSIYNAGVPGADAYELANVITPAGTRIQIDAAGPAGVDQVVVTPAFDFAWESPRQRVFLVEGPVTWLCDPIGGTLSRYSGYAIAGNQSARDSDAELVGAGAAVEQVAGSITGCAFVYAPGISQRAGLVTMDMSVARQGEQVALLHQVHVDNVP